MVYVILSHITDIIYIWNMQMHSIYICAKPEEKIKEKM